MFWTMIVLLASMTLAGCAPMLAGAVAVSTPDEIKRSEYVVRLTSDTALARVTSCMKHALLAYRNEAGRSPYAAITYRDTESPHQIMLSNNLPSSWSGVRPELLFFLENSTTSGGGTTTQVWAHQRLLSDGGSQGYLDRVVSAVRPCVGAGVHTPPATSAGGPQARTTTDESMKKLEQLKNLADRGVITKEDFEKKKKDILEGL